MKPTKKQVEDLISQVIELRWSQAIWWELVVDINADKYKVFDTYPNFFRANSLLMLQSVFVIIARLFDRKKETISLITLMDKFDPPNKPLSDRLRAGLLKHGSIIEKIRRARHKIYAHRDGKIAPEQIFKEIKIAPQSFDQVVRFVQEIVAEIAGPIEADRVLDNFRHCGDDAVTETRLIVQCLAKHS